MSAKDYITKMVSIFDQVGALNDDLKVIKDEAKAAGFNPADLATVAKATSDGKLGKLRQTLEERLDLLDEQEGA